MPETILDQLGSGWMYRNPKGLADALHKAKMHNWNIRRAPVYVVLDDRDIRLPRSAVMRTNPADRTQRDILGETGDDNPIVSNEDFGAYMLRKAEDLGLAPHSVGSADDGRKVFFSLAEYEELMVGGEYYTLLLVGLNSHDSTTALQLRAVAVHERTGAVLDLDLGGEAAPLKFRTRILADGPPTEDIREMLGGFRTALQDRLETLVTVQVSNPYSAAVEALGCPPGAPQSTQSRYENKARLMLGYLPEGDNVNGQELLLAACAWYDFSSPIRSAKLGELVPLRATRAMFHGSVFKSAALRRITS